MKKFLSLIVVLMLAFNVKAQFVTITKASDFTFSDNGTEKTLFEVLDGGQHALLYFLNYQSTSDATTSLINGVYNGLGKNQNDVYMIGLDAANESVLLNQWAFDYEVEYPLVAKDKAYHIAQTYGGTFGVMSPTLVLIAPNHDIVLKEIWPINSIEQVVGIINENLVTDDDNTGNEGGDDNIGNEGGDDNTGNEGGDDEDDNIEIPVGPAAPNVVATTTETTVTLTWNAVEGATEYNIYTPDSFTSNVYGITETTYTFEGLTASTEYCFEVSAVYPTDESNAFKVCATTKTPGEDEGGDDNIGDEGGDDNTGNEGGDDNTGNEGGDDNTGNEGGDDNTGEEGGDDNEEQLKPEIPNVVATTTETTVTLTWDAIEGATSYNIYTPKSFDSNVLGLEDTTYTFEGLTAGKKYCFEVSAVYPTDESDVVEVCATTKTEGEDDGEDPEYPEPTTVPSAPVINVYAENSGLIVVEWEAVETAMFYYVYHKGKLVGDGQVLGTEVEIKVYPETEYCFTVTAVNTVGESEHSNEACATTPAEGEDPENPDGNVEVAENDFVIYPNPVNDRLYIETQTLTQTLTIEVYDIFGRQQDLSAISGQQSVINVANLNSGIYFVKVVTENGEVVKRFVKK